MLPQGPPDLEISGLYQNFKVEPKDDELKAPYRNYFAVLERSREQMLRAAGQGQVSRHATQRCPAVRNEWPP